MIDGASEHEFHAPVAGGEIVGWVRGSGPPTLLLHGGLGLSEYLVEEARPLLLPVGEPLWPGRVAGVSRQ